MKAQALQRIYLVAGESSGDLLGASLMRSLKIDHPQAEFFGVGGQHMQEQGLQSLFPMNELSIMGIVGILKNIIPLRRRLKQTIQDILEKKPQQLITIDAPEFSLRVASAIRKLRDAGKLDFDIELVHEVAPTVWAWRPGRAPKMAKIYDRLLCLYPMEPPLFEAHGLHATFIGHPVVNDPLGDASEFWGLSGLDPQAPLLCVLPGSRRSEVSTLLPIFKGVVNRLQQDIPNLQVVIPMAPHVKTMIESEASTWDIPHVLVEGETWRRHAFAASTAAVAASGTIALQLAHARVPFVIAYKMGAFSAWIARRLLITKWACMINILAGREIIPEFIQDTCREDLIVAGILPLLVDPKARAQQVAEMTAVMDTLRPPSL